MFSKYILLQLRNIITPVSYTHLDVYKRQVYLHVLCFNKGNFKKPDVSAVPSIAIISENRLRKREVVYVRDHSTVVKAEPVSRKK